MIYKHTILYTSLNFRIRKLNDIFYYTNKSLSQNSYFRSVVVAKVEQNGPGTLVDVDKIRASLAANGFGIISGMDGVGDNSAGQETDSNTSIHSSGHNESQNIAVIGSSREEVVSLQFYAKISNN